jgi:glycosyltransferase involved in cell wall biosynthesis
VIWYYDRIDFILVPSLSTGKQLVERGIDPAKVHPYPRGIDVEAFHPVKRSRIVEYRLGLTGRFRLLYVGRVSKEKNLELLVRVFKRLVQNMSEVTLIVVGDGPPLLGDKGGPRRDARRFHQICAWGGSGRHLCDL